MRQGWGREVFRVPLSPTSAVLSDQKPLCYRTENPLFTTGLTHHFCSLLSLTNQDELSINWTPSKPKPHFQGNKKRKTKKVHMISLGWANMDHVTWFLHWLNSTPSSHRWWNSTDLCLNPLTQTVLLWQQASWTFWPVVEHVALAVIGKQT